MGYEQGLLKSLEQSERKVTLVQANRVRQLCSCGWDPEQDGQNRRSCALSLWRSDAAIANSATLGRAKATALIRSPTPASERSLRGRTKSTQQRVTRDRTS